MSIEKLKTYDVRSEWVQLQFSEPSPVQDVYAMSSTKGVITIEGVRFNPGNQSKTLLIYMHPASTPTILPVPKTMAAYGFHVLAAGSRYTRNDTTLIMEKVLRDLGAYVRHAREVWGYEKVVLAGWSGGGSLMTFYQAQAERPTLRETPAGDPVDVKAFELLPADGVIFHAAHISRAFVLLNCIDPSVLDETDPRIRDVELDLYDPRNPHKPPYSAEYMARFRAAQRARMDRKTRWVKQMLSSLREEGGKENERGFITHRTIADPRFLDPTIDPSDRPIGTCWMGDPETANAAASGLARFSTLRSWLSQWSISDTNVDGVRDAASMTVPLLAIANSADDGVLGPQVREVYEAAPTARKSFFVVKGANHYYTGQPDQLRESAIRYRDWMEENHLL